MEVPEMVLQPGEIGRFQPGDPIPVMDEMWCVAQVEPQVDIPLGNQRVVEMHVFGPEFPEKAYVLPKQRVFNRIAVDDRRHGEW